jgi:hypothetical protein
MANEINQLMFVEEYEMVHAHNAARLSDLVNEKIKEGFLPTGRTFGGANNLFCEMVKYNSALTKLANKIVEQVGEM